MWAAGAAVLASTVLGGSLATAATRPAAAAGSGSSPLTAVAKCGKGPNLITDGSFETANPGDFPTGDTTDIPGWAVGSAGGSPGSVDVSGTGEWISQNGVLSIDLNGDSPGSVIQNVTDIPGQHYALCFWLAGNVDNLPTIKKMRARWDNTSTTYTFNITGKTPTSMGWTQKMETVSGTGSDTVKFAAVSPGAFGAVIDNVTLRAI